ncbi:hypothetical protein D3C84_1169740 [compost metagenome]
MRFVRQAVTLASAVVVISLQKGQRLIERFGQQEAFDFDHRHVWRGDLPDHLADSEAEVFGTWRGHMQILRTGERCGDVGICFER